MRLIGFIALALAAVFTLSGCGNPAPPQFLGEWISPQAGISMDVGAGQRLRIAVPGKPAITCSYTVDWTQTPPHIDLVPDLKTDQAQAGVVQFDGKDGLRLCVSGFTSTPTRMNRTFDPKSTILFIRKEKAPGDKKGEPDLRPPPVATIEKSRLRATATAILQELRMLDGAVDQWAIENGKKEGDVPTPRDVLPYFKSGTPIHTAFAAGRAVDSLGNPLGLSPVGRPPTVSRATVEKLSSSVSEDFWGSYWAR